MAKRRRKSTPKRRRITIPARFAVGDPVRVRPGVVDPDYPDIPLGGWAGVVEEVDRRGQSPSYLVAWDQHTVEQMHPVYRKRCERDDLDAATMWLTEADLEPDTGEPAAIEQPAQLVTRPLRLQKREDRIRMVFGLTSDDPIPEVSRDTLRRYHAYLVGRLTFPFPARFVISDEGERAVLVTEHRIEVTGLLGPREADLEFGLRCNPAEGPAEVPLAMLTVPQRHPNRALIDDYAYWFENWPADSDDMEEEETSDSLEYVPDRSRRGVVLPVIVVCVLGAVYGTLLGGAIGAVEQTGLAAAVAAAVLGLLGVLMGMTAGARNGGPAGRMERVYQALRVGSGGALIGGLAGVLLVVLVAAYPGALIGGLVGAIIGGLAARGRTPTLWSLLGALIAALIGSYGLAVAREPADALTGALYGAAIGAASGALLHLVEMAVLMLRHSVDD